MWPAPGRPAVTGRDKRVTERDACRAEPGYAGPMTRLASVAALLLVACIVQGCGPASSSPPVVTEPAAPVTGEVVDGRDEEEGPPAPLAPVSDAELDAMDRSELELRCEQGSTAACDRLGH